MYKGIGQYFPFHVEMNPFQKGQNSFHPRLYSQDFREAPFLFQHAAGRKKGSKTFNGQDESLFKGNMKIF